MGGAGDVYVTNRICFGDDTFLPTSLRSVDLKSGMSRIMSGPILIVEDELDLCEVVDYALRREGFRTSVVHGGLAALETARELRPELILLDLMLPDLSGVEVCKRLRVAPETKRTPVLMVTAKGEEVDRVVGFEVGADDYVVKPFSVRELILRMRAILRRRDAAEQADGEVVTFGRLRVDVAGHGAWVDDLAVPLTALELKLLSHLLARRGRVQTRDALLSEVWGTDSEVIARTVDTHVKRLREKLGPARSYIETIRGVGYRCRARAEDIPATE